MLMLPSGVLLTSKKRHSGLFGLLDRAKDGDRLQQNIDTDNLEGFAKETVVLRVMIAISIGRLFESDDGKDN